MADQDLLQQQSDLIEQGPDIQTPEMSDQTLNYLKYGEGSSEGAELSEVKRLGEIKTEQTGLAGNIKTETDEVVKAKAVESLVGNMIKAFAAYQGMKTNTDMSGVDIKSGIDWDLYLKGTLGQIQERQRVLEEEKGATRQTLADRIRFAGSQKKDAEAVQREVAMNKWKQQLDAIHGQIAVSAQEAAARARFAEQEKLQGSSQEFTAGQADLNRDLQRELAGMRQKVGGMSAQRKEKNRIDSAVLNNNSKVLEADAGKAQKLSAYLNLTDAQPADADNVNEAFTYYETKTGIPRKVLKTSDKVKRQLILNRAQEYTAQSQIAVKDLMTVHANMVLNDGSMPQDKRDIYDAIKTAHPSALTSAIPFGKILTPVKEVAGPGNDTTQAKISAYKTALSDPILLNDAKKRALLFQDQGLGGNSSVKKFLKDPNSLKAEDIPNIPDEMFPGVLQTPKDATELRAAANVKGVRIGTGGVTKIPIVAHQPENVISPEPAVTTSADGVTE